MIPLLDCQDLVFCYPDGTEALRRVSLQLMPGESLALLGRNGSGKTTLSKVVMRLLRQTGGELRILGEEVSTMRPAQQAARVGYAFQDPDDQLFLASVQDELVFNATRLGIPVQERESRSRTVASHLGLEPFLHLHPFDLGDSFRKLVAIGAVLVAAPPILILDEPTSGLSHDQLDRLFSVLAGLSGQGTSLILISHDIGFASALCSRFAVMEAGRIVLQGDPLSVLGNPRLPELTALEGPYCLQLSQQLRLPQPFLQVDPLWLALRNRPSENS